MKRILRIFIVESVALYLISQMTDGLNFQNGTQGLLVTAFALGIASLLVKPVINLFLLPLNLLTFGLFRFLTNTITIFIVDLVTQEFLITSFTLKGFKSELLVIPQLSLPSGPLSYIAFSLLISLVTGVIYWLIS